MRSSLIKALLATFCYMLVTADIFGITGIQEEWDIEKVVKAALENSEAIIRVGEELRQIEIDLQTTKAISQSALTVTGEVTRTKNPITGKYELNDEEEIMLSIPLTPKLVVGAPATVHLDYYPFAESVEEAEAQLNLSLKQLEFQKTMAHTELEARKQYITLLAARKKKQQAEESLILAEQALMITERRFQAGLVSGEELDRAETEILEAQVQLASMKMDEYVALRTLSRLIKSDLSKSVFIELSAFPEKYNTDTKMLENVLKNNIEIKKSQLLLVFARENLKRVKKNRPVITLSAITDTEDWELALSGSLTWKIEVIYPRRLELAEIAVKQQERIIETLRETVEDSLAIAIRDFELQYIKTEALEHKKNLATRSSIDAQKKYENGEILLVNLEKVRLAARIAQEDYITGWNNLWQAWYVLLAIIAF